MRKISSITTNDDWTLDTCFDNGELCRYDVKPLLDAEAFQGLQDLTMFKTARNGGYFVEWQNEADLSADTLYLEGSPVKVTDQTLLSRSDSVV